VVRSRFLSGFPHRFPSFLDSPIRFVNAANAEAVRGAELLSFSLPTTSSEESFLQGNESSGDPNLVFFPSSPLQRVLPAFSDFTGPFRSCLRNIYPFECSLPSRLFKLPHLASLSTMIAGALRLTGWIFPSWLFPWRLDFLYVVFV